MKKRCLAIILCIVTIVTMVFPVYAQPDGESDAAVTEDPELNIDETAPIEELIPVSYEDYLFYQSESAFNYPALFVGMTAEFNPAFKEVYYLADPEVESIYETEDENCIPIEEVFDENGNSIKVVITDYKFVQAADEESVDVLWFKIEAAEGYTLPQVLVDNPYIWHVDTNSVDASLLMKPLKAVFIDETVYIQKQMVDASAGSLVTVANVPAIFDVAPVLSEDWYIEWNIEWYDLGDVSSWEGVTSAEHRYVSADVIYLIPAEVQHAYEKLLGAENKIEYNNMWNQLPEVVKEQFTQKHMANLDEFKESLPNGVVEYSASVDYFGQDITVTVSGDLPAEDVSLSVVAVADETVLEEGFNVTAADIVTALDIKIIKDVDGTEWQPGEGETIAVSIDVTPFGYEEGDIVKLHHKHEDTIQEFDIFIVLDGKVTVYTEGFSIYVVANPLVENPRTQRVTPNNNNPPVLNLTVGDHIVYYARPETENQDWWGNVTINEVNYNYGTWEVIDTEGAIHYIVHSNQTIGNGGMKVPWIEIYALKEVHGTERVTLKYNYYYNNGLQTETYILEINGPEATGNNANANEENGRRLYLKDEVNTTGCITATVVDTNGNEISLEGASFSWSRYDAYNGDKMFIVPPAYENDYRSVNIARDHGGLVEARKDANGNHVPVTYTCVVTLANGDKLTASYTVYYQSEILNAGFESPAAPDNTYSFFPNGWNELFWKTTAPGSEANDKVNVSKDIEYGDVKGDAAQAGTSYGVTQAADYDDKTKTGYQFAELNAEAFGSLYQDIITAPGETIEWEFAHAPRPGQNWGNTPSIFTNKMFIIIGATEDAQNLTSQSQLTALGQLALDQGIASQELKDLDGDGFYDPQPVVVTYEGGTYYVWYHDAGRYDYNVTYQGVWTYLEGTYVVPTKTETTDAQYRTRIFFVSEPTGSNAQNAGNLIDAANAGQYKSYLVEYYEESFDGTTKTTKHRTDQDEFGEALVYSSVPLLGIDHFVNKENDYLHQILINGANYPYNIRYDGDASLYIENYPVSGLVDPFPDSGKNYADYDIVVQIYIRDTVVAVQKNLVFPAALTEEQKLNIMNDLYPSGGYKADFTLRTTDKSYSASNKAVITQRDPAGKYTGYISLGDNPSADDVTYVVQETYTTPLPGLILDTVVFKTVRYSYGKGNELKSEIYNTVKWDGNTEVKSVDFMLTEEYKIAEITVTNTYKEKETTVYYKAIGNGKVAIADGEDNFEDLPSETLKFYSGVATGAAIYPGSSNGAKAVFVGWYLDEACTEAKKLPYESKYGVIDPVTGTFRPNANIIEQDKITFYAKFETSSITINRTEAEPYQTFVYLVQGNTNSDDDIEITMYVTVTCDANGNGSCLISDVGAGDYTVTELKDWSWRYSQATQSGEIEALVTGATEAPKLEFNFDNSYNNDYWLNGYSEPNRNMQGIANTQGSGGSGG